MSSSIWITIPKIWKVIKVMFQSPPTRSTSSRFKPLILTFWPTALQSLRLVQFHWSDSNAAHVEHHRFNTLHWRVLQCLYYSYYSHIIQWLSNGYTILHQFLLIPLGCAESSSSMWRWSDGPTLVDPHRFTVQVQVRWKNTGSVPAGGWYFTPCFCMLKCRDTKIGSMFNPKKKFNLWCLAVSACTEYLPKKS